jgi:hypothetical protein
LIFDARHKAADEHDASSAELFHVFRGGWIGKFTGAESAAFIFDTDMKMIGRHAVTDMDAFVRVHLIAMFDGIDDRFFECETDGENVAFAVPMRFERRDDFVLNAVAFTEITRDRDIHSSRAFGHIGLPRDAGQGGRRPPPETG